MVPTRFDWTAFKFNMWVLVGLLAVLIVICLAKPSTIEPTLKNPNTHVLPAHHSDAPLRTPHAKEAQATK